MKAYLFNLLIALDQFANTLTGGNPDMTLSGRWGRLIMENRCVFCKFVCRILDYFDMQHCQDAAKNEEDEWRL